MGSELLLSILHELAHNTSDVWLKYAWFQSKLDVIRLRAVDGYASDITR